MLSGEQRFSGSERRTVTVGVKLPARVQTLSVDQDNAAGTSRPHLRLVLDHVVLTARNYRTAHPVPRTEVRVRVSQAAAVSGESEALTWRAAT